MPRYTEGWKRRPPLYGPRARVELDPEAAVDLHLAAVVLPRHAEDDLALRLADPLDDLRARRTRGCLLQHRAEASRAPPAPPGGTPPRPGCGAAPRRRCAGPSRRRRRSCGPARLFVRDHPSTVRPGSAHVVAGHHPGRAAADGGRPGAPCAPRAAARCSWPRCPRMCAQVVLGRRRGPPWPGTPPTTEFGGTLGARGDDGAGGHDRARADVRAVHHDAAHAHQDVVVDPGPVQHHAVADGDALADQQREARRRSAACSRPARWSPRRSRSRRRRRARRRRTRCWSRGPIVTAPTTTAVGATKASLVDLAASRSPVQRCSCRVARRPPRCVVGGSLAVSR